MGRTELFDASRRRHPYAGEAATSYIRAVTASVMAAKGEPPSVILRRGWPDDRSADTVLKAATNPATTGVPGWAGALTMQRPADFVGMLAPSSCGLSLLQKCLQFEWPTGVNSLQIPAIDVSPARTPWQSEGSPISNVMFTTSVSAPMTPAKIASIVVLSREILTYSLPSAELMVRTALGESLGIQIDTALQAPSLPLQLRLLEFSTALRRWPRALRRLHLKPRSKTSATSPPPSTP
jgi:hypothetical protein